jgi:general secretion pathway protein D
MRYLNNFIILGLLVALAILSGCSAAKSAFSKGEKLESEGKFEEAMYSYADAFMKDPEAGPYRIRFFSTREKAAAQRFKTGSDLFAKSEYAAAQEQFQAGLALDPTQSRFKQQADIAARFKEAQQAYRDGFEFEKGNKFKDANLAYARALELHPDKKEYQTALTRIAKLRKSKLDGFELNLKSTKPITLKFKDAKIKDVFNIVTQLTGINFIFDEGIKDTPVSIYLENATFYQAFDLLINMNKLGRKTLNENTVIVYPNSPDKKKQYEDMQLRTFHLNYMDAKKAVNLIRTMIQVRKVYVNEDSNSVVVRDTSDIVDVVEKILDANDVPDAEVVLDVEVIEVSDTQTKTLGLLLSDYSVKLGAFSQNNQLMSSNSLASTTSTIASGAAVTENKVSIDNLVKAFSMGGYGGFVTVPNATYNFGKTLANGEVLSNPKIRVKNKEKSKFNVGQRVPITTTTLNGTLSQVNVQYVDVGVKVNAEPNIQLNNDIIIKLSLEVSSILTKEKVGGTDSLTTVVTIGTRNLETVLSLRDGETSIIGGLISNTQSDSKQKVFLLGDLPLLGPLLSNNVVSKDKTELILAITPRLVRGVTVPQNNLMSFSSGKEDDPSLIRSLASFDQEPVFDATPQPKGSEKRPAATKPPVAPVVAPPATTVTPLPNSAVPAVPVTPATPAVTTPAPAQRGMLQIAAPPSVPVGQQFSVDIKASSVAGLLNAPFVLSYDPVFVEFVSMTEGPFMKQDGKATKFSNKVDAAGGTVSVSLAREAVNGGVTGAGSLAAALFRAKNQGSVGFAFKSVGFSGMNGVAITILPFSTAVDIK